MSEAKKKRILLVDDNPVIIEILTQFLGSRYRVDSAKNASQALAALIRSQPDVVLLDVRMPGVDGISLLKSLRGMGVAVPIFVITGYDSNEIADEALRTGADAYLSKPFDLLQLERMIADAISTARV